MGERVPSPSQPPGQPAQRRSADDAAQDAVIRPAPGVTVAQEALEAAPAPPPARAEIPPPWASVLATTIRLWWQRRVRPRTGNVRSWVLTVLVLVLAAAALGVVLSSPVGRTGAASGPVRRGQPVGTAALSAAAAARTAAARWVGGQVAADAIVACDPHMCAALQQAGVPASRLLALGPGASGPLGSDVLVATAAVRQEFGARLASVYAPDVLASFGTGPARVDIRVVAPDGAAAYVSSLRADQATRVSAGQQLLRNPRIHASAAAVPALAGGQVDAQLLTVFATLAALHPVRVLGFAAAPRGISPGLPLRTAYLAAAGPGTRQRPSSVRALASFLRAQLPPYRPARVTEVRLPGGGSALRVEFAAPTPLGLLGRS